MIRRRRKIRAVALSDVGHGTSSAVYYPQPTVLQIPDQIVDVDRLVRLMVGKATGLAGTSAAPIVTTAVIDTLLVLAGVIDIEGFEP